MKISFLTTIFPMPQQYLIDFFNSLKNQTYKNFDVVVINDGYKEFDRLKEKFNLNIIELKYSNTPAKNREYGINYCKKNYDIIIFGDSDDFFDDNRVKKSIELLQNYDIIVNDLSLCDENGKVLEENYFSYRLKNNFVFDFKFIENKNICGLSNTAINLKILDKVDFPNDIVAVDWYLYKNLLKKQKAIFINETKTYYRQYSNNTLGLKLNGKYLFWHEKEKNENKTNR